MFLISQHPHVFSNGYQIKFSQTPPPGVKIGYIFPEWVDSKPSVKDLTKIYWKSNNTETELPMTTLVLPLREDKVEAILKTLDNIHPEMILFMSKIRKLSVRKLGVKSNKLP